MKVRGPVIGLVLSVITAIAAFWMNSSGIPIFQISKNFSAMYYIFIIAICFIAYNLILLATTLRIYLRKGTYNEVKMLKGFYRMMAGMAIFICFFYVLGTLSAFGTFFSLFGGMLLGWSLQAPVSGFAAWIMITLMRPYKIGDRIQLPNYGLTGDVVKFSPMYLTFNQVGGTIGSEEPTGRMVYIPNAILFSAVVINYTYQQKKEESAYILDEALFRVTLDSDWDTVEQILLDTVNIVTKDIIEKTGVEPYIRADTWDYGTLFRLRYMTDSTDRPRIMYEIVKISTKEIQKNKNIDLAIPYVYSFKRGVETSGTSTVQKSSTGDTELIEINRIYSEKLTDETFWAENKEEVQKIAESIEKEGLLQPVMVSRNLTDDNYTLLFGEKRLKACMILGWEKVPAIVKNKFGTDIIRSKQFGDESGKGS